MEARLELSGRSFAVVGGGIVGLSLARALRKRGGEVLLVEARRAGGGASGAAAGILPQPGAGRSLLERLTRGAHAGYERWLAQVEEESGSSIEFRRSGYAELALSREDEADLRRRLEGLLSGGSPARWLGSGELSELAQGLTDRARGALLLPGTSWVHPPGLVAALRRSVERLGVEVREGEAAALCRSARGFEITLGRAPGERITGREVLVAAGAWTTELLQAAAVAPPAPVRPIRGQMVEVECRAPPSAILGHGDVYLIPRPEGAVWVGATVEDVGFDETTTEEGISWLIGSARSILPELGPVRRSWVGLRPKLLRRGGPLLGEGEPPVLAGHYKSGIHLGPLTAHLLAARLAGEREPDVSPFELVDS